MDATSNLKLPYILAAQSQKHVTHNEALRALDALVQLAVLDKDLATPPVSPDEGDRYIVAASPTGAWSGQAGRIAAYQDGAWAFYVPQQGWQAWVADEEVVYVFDGTVWAAGSGGPVSLLGVNATADATNRLSLSSPASLFNHEGAGHQIKINKNAPGDTGSVLFQTGFSGRAEFGLAGDDDFHVKVSADGSAWHEALVIDRSSGVVSLPLTPRREKLTANRTYYVRSDGNNANSGLANTGGGAWATLQHAYNWIAANLDLAGFTVTIQLGPGNYAGLNLSSAWTGGGQIIMVGDEGTPSNVTVTSGSIVSVTATLPGPFRVRGIRSTSTSQSLVHTGVGPLYFRNLIFANTGFAHIQAGSIGAKIWVEGNYSIGSSVSFHMYIAQQAAIQGVTGATPVVTFLADVTVSAFVNSQILAMIWAAGFSFDLNGFTCSGQRYAATGNGVILTNGGGANFFPGSTNGAVSSGGQYS